MSLCMCVGQPSCSQAVSRRVQAGPCPRDGPLGRGDCGCCEAQGGTSAMHQLLNMQPCLQVITDTDGNGNYDGGAKHRQAWWRVLFIIMATVAVTPPSNVQPQVA